MKRLDVDWEYVSPKDVFAGQIWMGISEHNGACLAESDLVSSEIDDITACKRNPESGFVCDLDGQKDIAANLVSVLYANGYTLVVCVDRGNEVVDGKHKSKNGDPESDDVFG